MKTTGGTPKRVPLFFVRRSYEKNRDLLPVIEDENLSEFQYLVDGDDWNIVIR